MPAAPPGSRTLRPAVSGIAAAALAGFAALSLLASAGCGSLAGARRVVDRAGLVNELASRLDRSSKLTFSAEYRLAGGTATIAQAQQPLRTAYTYPGGRVVIDKVAVTRCQVSATATTCTLTPPPNPVGSLDAGVLDATRAHGLAVPALVISLLTAAALDRDAVIDRSGGTVAGRPATCVSASQVRNAPASAFRACITDDGVLGSFRGDVSGVPLETSLTGYTRALPAGAFDLPSGTTVVDQRRPSR